MQPMICLVFTSYNQCRWAMAKYFVASGVRKHDRCQRPGSSMAPEISNYVCDNAGCYKIPWQFIAIYNNLYEFKIKLRKFMSTLINFIFDCIKLYYIILNTSKKYSKHCFVHNFARQCGFSGFFFRQITFWDLFSQLCPTMPLLHTYIVYRVV